MPDKKIGGNSFIFQVSLSSYQLLQKNRVLFVSLVSENKQKILKDAFKEIGTCKKTSKTKGIAIKDVLDVNKNLFLLVNLFRVL